MSVPLQFRMKDERSVVGFKFCIGDRVRVDGSDIVGSVVALMVGGIEMRRQVEVVWLNGGVRQECWLDEFMLEHAS